MAKLIDTLSMSLPEEKPLAEVQADRAVRRAEYVREVRSIVRELRRVQGCLSEREANQHHKAEEVLAEVIANLLRRALDPMSYNDGYVVTCMDDLCRGNGGEPGTRCMHGDGDIPCPDCDRAMYGW